MNIFGIIAVILYSFIAGVVWFACSFGSFFEKNHKPFSGIKNLLSGVFWPITWILAYSKD